MQLEPGLIAALRAFIGPVGPLQERERREMFRWGVLCYSFAPVFASSPPARRPRQPQVQFQKSAPSM